MVEMVSQWAWVIEAAVKKTAQQEDWVTLIFTKSGFCLYFILLCSVLGFAIILMKMISLQTRKILPPQLGAQFLELARQRDMQGLADLCQKYQDSPLARVTASGLELTAISADAVEKEMTTVAGFELQARARYLRALGVFSNVSMFFGLLGTVTGMISAFRNIASQGTTSTDIVAAGVYEALLTTAEGLFVAIPLYVAFHYFRSRINRFADQFEEYSTRFVKALFYGSSAGGPAR